MCTFLVASVMSLSRCFLIVAPSFISSPFMNTLCPIQAENRFDSGEKLFFRHSNKAVSIIHLLLSLNTMLISAFHI
ncbi:hypothetical protein GDO81_028387 [Engystomops pustulosus]|uniref:Secreted protein n=1 Tax=Engystomops pustulosus TaxID=76066 RepID=A0AAV6ZM56_ENGPU|nr:hypothetical protein GDO81_028387 [Engystomops pustulosus]